MRKPGTRSYTSSRVLVNFQEITALRIRTSTSVEKIPAPAATSHAPADVGKQVPLR